MKNNTKSSFSFTFRFQAPGVCVSQYNNLVTFLKVDDAFAFFYLLFSRFLGNIIFIHFLCILKKRKAQLTGFCRI